MAGRTFIFREDWLEFLVILNEKQREHVIYAACCHAFGQNLPKLSQIEMVAFTSIKGSIDRDMNKFEERKAKNRENGKKGGRPRSEKTEKNPEKPFGFENNQMVSGENHMVSEDLRSVSNPIPIPISNTLNKESIALSPSYNSSPDGSELEGVSEEEKERILYEFVFVKNLAAPQKELREFLSFNNRDGRIWSRMSDDRKSEAITRWQQQPPRPPRFQPAFLRFWKGMYDAMVETGAPTDVLQDAMSESVSFNLSGMYNVIHCTERVKDYIEQEEMLTRTKPVFKELCAATKRPYTQYTIESDEPDRT